jgi:prefoldin beta subunit
LDRLESEAKVYKLVGPVMVKQDLEESRQNVQKRVDYITTEMYNTNIFVFVVIDNLYHSRNRVESLLADLMKKIETQNGILEKIRDTITSSLKTS